MQIRSLAFVALLALTLTACDSGADEPGADFEIGGTYSGTFQDSAELNEAELTIPDTPDGDTFTFQYSLVESDGNGTIFSETTVDGTGIYNHPAISLTVEGETISGTASDDGDTVRLDDGEGDTIVLTRD